MGVFLLEALFVGLQEAALPLLAQDDGSFRWSGCKISGGNLPTVAAPQDDAIYDRAELFQQV
jgi:hypothetical protein